MLEHPDWVRRLNLFGHVVGGSEHLVSLDPSELLATARAVTGLDDLGDDDLGSLGTAGWEEAYRVVLGAIDSDAAAHLLGRLMTRAEMLRVIQTRLRLVEHWKRFPEIVDEPIEAPVFVIGPPRTGTSILFELLARDPALRAPIAWETHYPLGPLTAGALAGAPAGSPAGVPSLAAVELAECEQELWADVHPPFRTMHELASDLPAECVHFTALEFRASMYWSMCYSIPTYDTWARGRDLAAVQYRFHRRFLQTLQHRAGAPRRRWLLKSPGHLANVECILAEYPDARFVHTHRDPTKFVASVANMMAATRFIRSDVVDPLAFGPAMALGFRYMLEHVIALRENGTIAADHIADIHFRDLMADPIAAIEDVYEHLELPFAPGFDRIILSYLAEKPKDKFGKHQYDPAALDIDDTQIRLDFDKYVARYDIALE